MTDAVSATTDAGRMRWVSAVGFTPDEPDRVATPQIIDSWLLEEGGVRELSRHEARFADGCGRLEAAHHQGVTVRYERCQLAEVIKLPVWTANALHGLRRVSRGTGCPGLVPAQAVSGLPLRQWQEALQTTAAPLTGGVDGHPHSIGAAR